MRVGRVPIRDVASESSGGGGGSGAVGIESDRTSSTNRQTMDVVPLLLLFFPIHRHGMA